MMLPIYVQYLELTTQCVDLSTSLKEAMQREGITLKGCILEVVCCTCRCEYWWVGAWVGGAAVPFEGALAHLDLVADHWRHT